MVEPALPRLALLAGTFTLAWAPLDMARLATVQTSMNSGATFATLLALVLFAESWRRARPALLLAALAAAFLAARSYEATLGMLAGGPLLLAAMSSGGEGSTRGERLRWSVAWLAGISFFAALAARPLIEGRSASLNQAGVLGVDPDAVRYARRIAQQYALHIGPVVRWDLSLRPDAGVLLATLAFACAVLVARPEHGAEIPAGTPGRLARLALLGLALAGLGYSVLALSPAVTNATRMQFLAAPGIALFLAAAVALLALMLPRPARAAAELVAACAVVALGTGHMVAMQREWDRISFFPAQHGTVLGLLREAPSLRDNTLLLLLDEDGAWPYALTFRHAVRIAYGPAVVVTRWARTRFSTRPP